MLNLTLSIARECGPQGARASAACPAMAQTAMFDGLSAPQLEKIAAHIPLRRLGTAGDAAGACLFLASSLSNDVTGCHARREWRAPYSLTGEAGARATSR